MKQTTGYRKYYFKDGERICVGILYQDDSPYLDEENIHMTTDSDDFISWKHSEWQYDIVEGGVMTYTTDEENLQLLLSHFRIYAGKVPVLIVAIAQTHAHIHWLCHHVAELDNDVVWKAHSNKLCKGNVTIQFYTDNVDVAVLSSVQPVAWIPLSDRIPAAVIRQLMYQTERGQYLFEHRKRGGL